MPGGSEWILIVLAVLILFGGRKIPEFMRGIGKGIREFNDAKDNVKKEIEEGMSEKEVKKGFAESSVQPNCLVKRTRLLPFRSIHEYHTLLTNGQNHLRGGRSSLSGENFLL
jgi:sec-independent protein translocase protein TatA